MGTLGVVFVVVAVLGFDVALVYAIALMGPRIVELVSDLWSWRTFGWALGVTVVLVGVLWLVLQP